MGTTVSRRSRTHHRARTITRAARYSKVRPDHDDDVLTEYRWSRGNSVAGSPQLQRGSGCAKFIVPSLRRTGVNTARRGEKKKTAQQRAHTHTHKHAHGTGAHTRVTRRPAASARNKRRRRPKASGDAQSFFLAGPRYSHGPVRIRLFFFRRWAEPAAASWVRVM